MSEENLLEVDERISIPMVEIELTPIHSSGPGGQNVNKVATGIHLRFDLHSASLPTAVRERLLARNDQRITKEGVVVLKAQQHRTQERNRDEALARLRDLILTATRVPRIRRATKPSRSAIERRLEAKKHRARVKADRGRVDL